MGRDGDGWPKFFALAACGALSQPGAPARKGPHWLNVLDCSRTHAHLERERHPVSLVCVCVETRDEKNEWNMKSERVFFSSSTQPSPPSSSFHGAAPGTADSAATGSHTSLYLSPGGVMGEE